MIAERAGRFYRESKESTTLQSRRNIEPYFHSLSRIPPSVISWEKELLEALEGTNLSKSIEELKQQLHDYHQLIEKIRSWDSIQAEEYLPKELFHYESLVWAAGHYLSRRYPAHFATYSSTVPTSTVSLGNAEVERNSIGGNELLGNHGALVPLLDILNHKSDQPYLRFEISHDHHRLQIICNHPIKKGEEIFSNYGAISNGQLLFGFGYAVEENPHDEYLLKLKIPNILSFQSYLPSMIPPSNQSTVSQLYAIKRGGISGIDDSLLKMLELLDQHQTASSPSSPSASAVLAKNGSGISFPSSHLEKYETIMPFLLNQLSAMKQRFPLSAALLERYGVSISFTFPQETEEGDLMIDSHSFESKATLSYDPRIADNRARSIAYYLIGQYQIIIETIQEIDNLFAADDDEDDEEEEEEEASSSESNYDNENK